jgi:hypothetical protein
LGRGTRKMSRPSSLSKDEANLLYSIKQRERNFLRQIIFVVRDYRVEILIAKKNRAI